MTSMTDQSDGAFGSTGAGFTPGPWAYRSQPHDDWGVVRAGRYWICQAKDPRAIDDETLAGHRTAKTDPWEANARLIAAAPDLLAALIAAESLFAHTFAMNGTIHKQMRAAIALATGAAA